MSLKGKTAVVTGSTSGIGLAIALALAKDGCNIVVNGLGTEQDNAKAIAEVKKLGTRVTFDPANMLRHNQIADMIAKAERDFGSVDVLVNNAGIQHVSPVEEFPIEQWDAIIAINLTSAFHTVRAAVPGMKKRKWGRIINICSAHSLRASPFKSAYVSAKHGLAGFTKTVALELAEHGVTSNAISPGFVWTPLVEKQIPDLAKSENITEAQAKKQVLSRQPTGRSSRSSRSARSRRSSPAKLQLRSPAPTTRSTAAGPRNSQIRSSTGSRQRTSRCRSTTAESVRRRLACRRIRRLGRPAVAAQKAVAMKAIAATVNITASATSLCQRRMRRRMIRSRRKRCLAMARITTRPRSYFQSTKSRATDRHRVRRQDDRGRAQSPRMMQPNTRIT